MSRPLLFIWIGIAITTALSTRSYSFTISSQFVIITSDRKRECQLQSLGTSTSDPHRQSSIKCLGDGNDHDSIDNEFDGGNFLQDEQITDIKSYTCDGTDQNRRAAIATLLSFSGLGIPSSAVHASATDKDVVEFGTTSMLAMDDVTRQVRTSVIRGAQLIDKVDGQWERFSDNLGLGQKRNLPKRNVIDVGDNVRSKAVVGSEDYMIDGGYGIDWDDKFASSVLQLSDEVSSHRCAIMCAELMSYQYSSLMHGPVLIILITHQTFLSCLRTQQPTIAVTMDELHQRIDNTKQLTRKSFFPPSSIASSASSVSSKQLEFNFDCYAHFKVYNEILIKSNVIFPPFQKEFNAKIGISLLRLVLEQQSILSPRLTVPPPSTNLTECVNSALHTTDSIATFLQRHGLISSWERSIPPIDDIEDFATLSSDLTYSLALNGDITLNSQLLLQELGYRMYPAFGKWLIHEGISRCFNLADEVGITYDDDHKRARSNRNAIQVQIDDYYMDTNYNSNPGLFEVKQILLSIVIQR